jgi:hypothetical protein
MAESDGFDVPLSEMVEALRTELLVAKQEGEGSRIRFAVESVDLELKVGVTKSREGSAGIKFWVVQLGGKATGAREDVHTFRIKLKPSTPEGAPYEVSGTEPRLPGRPHGP